MAPRGLVPEGLPIDDPLDLHPLFRRYCEEPERPLLRRYPAERQVTS
jgi:hypothetical protein